ncbi:MAG: hypothetical protein M1830_007205 [Pleopsidium flavum]|nr:MAG: hypothetical protein M1830_007205 [Pleopsidium flavum]
MASFMSADYFSSMLSWKIAFAAATCVAIYGVGSALLKHLNHPLAKFPGPTAAAWSNIPYCYWFLGGRQPYKILELHEKYGPMVRTAPNELSFNTQGSWKDIYGLRQSHKPFTKGDFYDGASFAAEAHSIVSERDPIEHGKMRKYLSHAFSDRSLKEQEYLITEIVDLFISQIGKHGRDGLDLVMWFNLATFDIIGSLAFGEPFGGVASGTTHFWISIILGSLELGALADCFNRFPILGKVFMALTPKSTFENTARHKAYTIELVQKRINRKIDRKDFMVKILENRDHNQISDIQLAAQASDFVIAGSETTATVLSAITYYLLRTPDVMQKLQNEVRSAFKSYDDINAMSTAPLKYLQAVLLEGMRIYPPLPIGLPRVVPPGGDTVDGHFIPGGTIVSTNPVAASLSSANFEQPLEFKPERWLGQNNEDSLEASQPFSLGLRGCIGRNLAWMELRSILAKLHFTYDLKLLNDNLNWQRDSEMYTLWKKPELKVKVLQRQE